MTRMLLFAVGGAFVGMVFGATGAILLDRPNLNPTPLALFIVIATPIGALIGTIFGAVITLQEEARELRRELMRWQRVDEFDAAHAGLSTQFKSAPLEGR